MNEIPNSERLEALSDEFAERVRRGERPSVDEYIHNYPELADEIQEAFPVILMMEELAPTEHGPSSTEIEASENTSKLQLNNYKLIRELGRGGMGVVYEAEQKQLGRRVALKVLPSRMARQQAAVERFQREAQAAARLDHAHIVPIHEIGSEDGTLFYTMQLIRGQSMDVLVRELRLIRDHGLEPHNGSDASSIAVSICQEANSLDVDETFAISDPLADSSAANLPTVSPKQSSATSKSGVPGTFEYARSVARIGIQVADALRFAHERGVVHRDIKPSNLMIDPLVHVWVTDFGLAKLEESDLTNEGDVLGTLRYMAPEQLRGWADPRSDVYSLGLTLYELLVLRPAFETSNRAQLLQSIVEEQPPYLRALDSSIPRDLETIISKAIAKEPADRYQDSAKLRDDLRNFVEFRPISARRSTPIDSLRRWALRNKKFAVALAALFVMLLAWGMTASRSAAQAQQTLDDLYFAMMEGISEQVATGNYANILADIKKLEVRIDGHWEMEYVKRLLTEPHEVRFGAESALINVAVSPDGKWFATADYFSDVRVWDRESLEQMRVFTISTENLDTGKLAASPNGRTLALLTNSRQEKVSTLHLMDVHDRAHKPPTSLRIPGDFGNITFSGPSGEFLVFIDSSGLSRIKLSDILDGTASVREKMSHPEMIDYAIAHGQLHGTIIDQDESPPKVERIVWDITSQREVVRAPIKDINCRIQLVDDAKKYVVFLPDKDPTKASFRSSSIEVRDAASHKPITQFDFHQPLGSCHISPNGRYILGGMDGDLGLIDVATRQTIKLGGHVEQLRSWRFTPDSEQIISISFDQSVRVWSTASAQPEFFEGPEHNKLALSPDGSTLATNAGNEICLWDAKTLKLLRTLRGHIPQFHSNHGYRRRIDGFPMDFSSNGRKLVSGSEKGEVIVWDIEQGKPSYYAREAWGPCHNVRFHPGGKSVVGLFANGDCSVLDLASETWRQIGRDEGTVLWALAVSPDGKWVVPAGTVTTPRMIPYSALTGLQPINFENEILSLHHALFSSDGTKLVTGGVGRAPSIFDVTSGRRVAKMIGNQSRIRGIDITSDDKRVLTVGNDRSLRVFDLSNGKQLLKLQIQLGSLSGISIAPGNKSATVYTGGDRIRIWEPQRVDAQLHRRRGLYRHAQIVANEARFDERPLLVSEAMQRITSNDSLSAEVKAAALEHLSIHGEDVGTLFGSAWHVAIGAPKANVTPAIAIQYAEACRKALGRDSAEVTSLLGMVKYRNGDYEESLQLLRLARDEYARIEMAPDFRFSYKENGRQKEDRVLNELCLAMAEHKLETGNAKEKLRLALQAVDTLPRRGSIQAVTNEARELIGDL